MAELFCLPENLKVYELLGPAADAAGRTSAYVNLKDAQMAWVVFHILQGNAATIALSINQSNTFAGGGTTPITNVVPIWSNLDCAASDVLVRRTNAVNYATDAGVKHKIVIFQIDPAGLNTAGGFQFLSAITGASNAANITEAMIYMLGRYQAVTLPAENA